MTQENSTTQYKTTVPNYYTAPEAAQRLGYSDSKYLSKLCKEGKILAYKVGTTWLIPERQVEILVSQEVTGKGNRGQSRG